MLKIVKDINTKKQYILKAMILLISCIILFVIYIPSSLTKRKSVEIKRKLYIEGDILNKLVLDNKIDFALEQGLYLYNKYPKSSDFICTVLGDIYDLKGDLKDAEWFYREAVKIAPKEVYNYIKLSRFYMFKKEYNSTLLVLNTCNKFSHHNPLLLNEFANYYLNIKEHDKSIEIWERLFKYNSNIEYLIMIAKLYYENKDPRAKKYFNRYIYHGGSEEEVLRIKNE